MGIGKYFWVIMTKTYYTWGSMCVYPKSKKNQDSEIEIDIASAGGLATAWTNSGQE